MTVDGTLMGKHEITASVTALMTVWSHEATCDSAFTDTLSIVYRCGSMVPR